MKMRKEPLVMRTFVDLVQPEPIAYLDTVAADTALSSLR